MRTRTTIIWVLLSVASVFGYWYSGTLKVERQREAFEAKRMFDFEGKDVIRLSITTRENDGVEGRRLSENKWELYEPYAHVRPNHALWTDLAEKVVPNFINQRNIEAAPEDLAIYQLDDPPLTIVIETSRKELIQVDIGSADPTRNNHYAKLGSGEVFLLPREFVEALYRSLDDLRDKRVFPNAEYAVDKIRYVRHPVDDPNDGLDPEPGIDEVYTLGENGQWRITEPIDALAFQGEMVHLLNQSQFLMGEGFIDAPDTPADYGLEPAWAELTVMNTAEGTEETLQFGWLDDMSDTGRMFAKVKGNPTVFTVDAAFLEYLPEYPLDYRENHIFTALGTNLKSIQYTDTRNEFTLTIDDDDKWKLTDPPYDDTDPLRVSNLISGLRNIFGDRFPDEEEIDKYFVERARYTFTFRDGSPSTSVVIGAPVPGTAEEPKFYVRQDFGSVVTIPLQFREFLSSTAFRFRNPELMPFVINSASAVSIRIEGKAYELVRENEVWRVVEPVGHAIESSADMETILKAVRMAYALHAEDTAPPIDVTGMDAPLLEVTVTHVTADGTKVYGPLRVGNLIAEKSRSRFAAVEGRPETFYIDHALIENLRLGLQGIRPSEGL